MRSKEDTDRYQLMVAGMIKDIAFHQLFMEQFREENARDKLFDADMAYQLIDSLRSQEVSAYEIQGFLHIQGYEFDEQICQQIVSCLDKSLVHLNKQTFMNMMLPHSQQLRSQCKYKFEQVPVSTNDFDFWRRVKANTELKLCQSLMREAQFYEELLKRRQQFCHMFYGDVYSIMNVFGQKDQIGYTNIYEFLKSHKMLFNKDEYQALLCRIKHKAIQQLNEPLNITKEQLVSLIVTKNLSLKDKKLLKKALPKIYDPKKFSYYHREQGKLSTSLQTQSHYLQSLLSEPVRNLIIKPKELKYKFHYPQVQLTSTGNMYLLGEMFRKPHGNGTYKPYSRLQ